jgi:5'-deoxynucleotidase YfbR-like HD superfamily hydrolase
MNDTMLRNTRRLSFVPRWVVAPNIRQQSVAEHSYHVACIVQHLLEKHEDKNSAPFMLRTLNKALVHDADEATTGDAPGPTKDGTRASPVTLDQTSLIVKVADILEAYLFCNEEICMGNQSFLPMRDDVTKRGEAYWPFFRWGLTAGIKPTFAELAKKMAETTHLARHPILEGE